MCIGYPRPYALCSLHMPNLNEIWGLTKSLLKAFERWLYRKEKKRQKASYKL